jgi:uncharacterized protein YraI
MLFPRMFRVAALVVTPLLAAGCSASTDDDVAEEQGATDNALTSSAAEGTKLTTTARLNLRNGPSTSDEVLRIMSVGTVVTSLGESRNGFIHVSAGGDDGWAYSTYLRSSGGGSTHSSGKASSAGDDDDDDNVGGGGTPSGTAQTCKASFYDEGQKTANGERFDPNGLTAAHKTLPFNTRIRVTNTANGKSVDVRINDRGPFVAGRCLDLARGAFTRIASTSAGVATISFQVLH